MVTPKAILLFDGDCGLCDSSVRLLAQLDRDDRLRFAAQQSPLGQRLLAEWGLDLTALRSVVLIEQGGASLSSLAMLRAVRLLPWPWRLLSAFVAIPAPVREAVYQLIARNRYAWFGRATCGVPSAQLRQRLLLS